MERVSLTRREKDVMRLLHEGNGCPDTYPRHVFASCVEELERKGLAREVWASGHELVDARLSQRGET